MSATQVTIMRDPTEDEKALARYLHLHFTDHSEVSGPDWQCERCLDAAVVILRRFGRKGER